MVGVRRLWDVFWKDFCYLRVLGIILRFKDKMVSKTIRFLFLGSVYFSEGER